MLRRLLRCLFFTQANKESIMKDYNARTNTIVAKVFEKPTWEYTDYDGYVEIANDGFVVWAGTREDAEWHIANLNAVNKGPTASYPQQGELFVYGGSTLREDGKLFN
jgi:hypothetical protein